MTVANNSNLSAIEYQALCELLEIRWAIRKAIKEYKQELTKATIIAHNTTLKHLAEKFDMSMTSIYKIELRYKEQIALRKIDL